MRELPTPQTVRNADDAVELARIWVAQGDLHVSLNIGMYEAASGPGESTAWGDIMADTFRHIARAIAQKTGTYEHVCLRELVSRATESLRKDPRFMEGEFHL
jgi:hypothetical protein